MNKKFIHVMTYNNKIQAIWHRDCKQPYIQWKKAVKSLYPKGEIHKYCLGFPKQ